MIENRNGLLVDAELTQATGTAERDAALEMSAALPAGSTLGADKGYDTRGFVAELRAQRLTPHVAQNINRPGGSAIDSRTTRHEGYAISQRCRKRVEEPFGWAKTIGGLRQVKLRGQKRVRQKFLLVMAVYNLVRLRNLRAGDRLVTGHSAEQDPGNAIEGFEGRNRAATRAVYSPLGSAANETATV